MDASLKAQFWNDGFLIGDLRLPPCILTLGKNEIDALNWKPIFGEVYEEERDPFRLQSAITTFGPYIVQLSDENWYTKKSLWNALKSLPGGLRQGIHLDYPAFETSKAIMETGSVQASVIIALQEDTQFYVYPGCFGTYAEMDKCKLVVLNPGEFLIFRGDLVHAGAEFEEENLRLHYYVRVRGIYQRADTTEAAVFNSYMCEHCVLPCTSRRHLANHRRYCTDNPDKVKSKKARAEADARGGHCDKCNRDFKKRNALYQHNHRRHPKKPVKSSSAEELSYVYHSNKSDNEKQSDMDAEEESDSDVYIESDAKVDTESEEESADEREEGSEEEVSSSGDGSEAESEAWSDAESAEDSE
ncbi:hypothetical protein F444_16038 [Phytophthora nicotianae P1976]|uniref:C2H2-type domain-containing protein n=1 Tax=Phytophthora nicotianae P1976 TaxID=1317066 RepID=A0A080ZJU3_PHYNI|nr:hypothetical protein F444_16038 [Phytophthora nicotianae P1976]